MNKIILILLLLPCLLIGQNGEPKSSTKLVPAISNDSMAALELLPVDTAELLAQQQLTAYNLRDIEAFLVPYADDVEVYTYPNKLQYIGKETMRARYSKMFDNTPNLHCELVARIVQGNIVIDKEHVRFGDRFRDVVAIYHIENNKIKKVFFIR